MGKTLDENPSAAIARQLNEPSVANENKVAAEARSRAASDLTPKLIQRVHALYEELGRQDVLAVQALERAQKDSKEISH